MTTLDAALRQQIRQAIDQHARQLARDDDQPRCAGCGMPHDEKTPGCKRCWDRHRNRRHLRSCKDCGTRVGRNYHRCSSCATKAVWARRRTREPA